MKKGRERERQTTANKQTKTKKKNEGASIDDVQQLQLAKEARVRRTEGSFFPISHLSFFQIGTESLPTDAN